MTLGDLHEGIGLPVLASFARTYPTGPACLVQSKEVTCVNFLRSSLLGEISVACCARFLYPKRVIFPILCRTEQGNI